jgi:hypothetical protein
MLDDKIDEQSRVDTENNWYYFLECEIHEINSYLKQSSIKKNEKNTLWGIVSSIKRMLFRPDVKLNNKLLLNLKGVKISSELLVAITVHLPLFRAFDDLKVPDNKWHVYLITKKSITLLVKLSPEKKGEKSPLMLMKKASLSARNDGKWDSSLTILTMAEKVIKL